MSLFVKCLKIRPGPGSALSFSLLGHAIGLAHPTAPFVPLRGTAGTFGVGQDGSGGTGETPSQLLHISGKSRLCASGGAGCLSRVLCGVRRVASPERSEGAWRHCWAAQFLH
jgi:hypothetical protein